jgi:hypothetical protein
MPLQPSPSTSWTPSRLSSCEAHPEMLTLTSVPARTRTFVTLLWCVCVPATARTIYTHVRRDAAKRLTCGSTFGPPPSSRSGLSGPRAGRSPGRLRCSSRAISSPERRTRWWGAGGRLSAGT